MGPKSIPVRPSITPEVKKISTSQEAPTLRPHPKKPRAYGYKQQKSKPRAYGNETATLMKSLSPELKAQNSTKKEQKPKPSAYCYEETKNKETKIMKEKQPDREQVNHYILCSRLPYVAVGPLRQHHEALKNTKHASTSRNKTDLLHISRVQTQENMSKPVTTKPISSGAPSYANAVRQHRRRTGAGGGAKVWIVRGTKTSNWPQGAGGSKSGPNRPRES
jgi:hypothetical protein